MGFGGGTEDAAADDRGGEMMLGDLAEAVDGEETVRGLVTDLPETAEQEVGETSAAMVEGAETAGGLLLGSRLTFSTGAAEPSGPMNGAGIFMLSLSRIVELADLSTGAACRSFSFCRWSSCCCCSCCFRWL